jgi:Cu(I)/Ag(I) efflux system membrane fusion protein/cobalt-zinc-cadmium efflux system membrane fusion protein
MYVKVRLQGETVEDVLIIPLEAVLYSGVKQTVFVALGEGKFEPRQIKTGLQDDNGRIQVLQGLFEGEKVVTSAQFMLDSESKLREAIQKMLDARKEAKATKSAQASGADAVEDLFEEESKDDMDDLFK